mgnify:FL=1
MSELEDNQEMIFICEMVLQNPKAGTIITFQRDVNASGEVISTQSASIDATSTKNFNLFPDSGNYAVVGNTVGLGGIDAMEGSYNINGTDVTFTIT